MWSKGASVRRMLSGIRQRIVTVCRAPGQTLLTQLEAEFVKFAKSYSERKAISYAAWREVGVSAATLKAAGIGRGAA